MKKAILVAVVLFSIAVVGCKKDDDGDDTVTAADLIVATPWKIDTIGFDMNKDGEIDEEVPGGFDACELDNTLTFSRDSTGVFDEGATKCDPSDPQTQAFTWELSGNDSLITIEGSALDQLDGTINILTLTNTNFKMSKNIKSSFPVLFDGNLIVSLVK